MKSSISVGEKLRSTNTKIHKREEIIIKCVFVLVLRKFSPILILLLKHSRIYEGVPIFVLENPSYIFVYG
jgi:hypothetical protein